MGNVKLARLEHLDQLTCRVIRFVKAGILDVSRIEQLMDAFCIVALDRGTPLLADQEELNILAFGQQLLRMELGFLDDVRIEAAAQALIGIYHHQKVALVRSGACQQLRRAVAAYLAS